MNENECVKNVSLKKFIQENRELIQKLSKEIKERLGEVYADFHEAGVHDDILFHAITRAIDKAIASAATPYQPVSEIRSLLYDNLYNALYNEKSVALKKNLFSELEYQINNQVTITLEHHRNEMLTRKENGAMQ